MKKQLTNKTCGQLAGLWSSVCTITIGNIWMGQGACILHREKVLLLLLLFCYLNSFSINVVVICQWRVGIPPPLPQGEENYEVVALLRKYIMTDTYQFQIWHRVRMPHGCQSLEVTSGHTQASLKSFKRNSEKTAGKMDIWGAYME